MTTLRELTVGLNIQTDQGALTSIVQILGRMENIMRSVAKGMGSVEDQADDTADAIDDLGDAADKTEKKLDKATKTGNNFRKKLGEIATGAVKVAAGLLTLDAVKGVFSWVTGISKGAHALSDQAETLNSTIESYQRLSFISARAGVDQGAFASGLKKTSETITQAADKTSEMSKLYDQLGISVTNADGTMRGSADVMQDLQKAYQSDSVGNLDKIYKILGGSLNENINLFKLTEDEYKALNDQATKNGIVTQKQADLAKKLNDTFSNLTSKVSNFGTKIMVVVGPALIFAIKKFEEIISSVLKLFGVLKSDKSVEDWAWDLEEYVILAWNAFATFLNNTAKGFKDFKEFWVSSEESIKEWWEAIKPILVGFSASLAAIYTAQLPMLVKALFSAGTKLWAYVAATSAAALAQLALLASNPFTWIVIGIGLAAAAIYMLWKNWNKIKAWFLKAIDAIGKKFKSVFNSIKNTAKSIVSDIKSYFEGLISFLVGGFEKAGELIDKILGKTKTEDKPGEKKPFVRAYSDLETINNAVAPILAKIPSAASYVDYGNTVTNVGAINVTSVQADPKQVAKEVKSQISAVVDDGGKSASKANNDRRR